MWVAILVGSVVVVGIAAVVLGSALMERSQTAAAAANPLEAEIPEPVEQTTREGRERIIERAVYLALELARVDGAIAEIEMQAIEDHLTKNIVDMERDEAELVVRQVLRATIRVTEAAFAVKEIVELADNAHRKFVVEMLISVAASDGAINDEERGFAVPIAAKLGLEFKG